MKTNKTIAILFLLVANIVMFAHAIIPHHHHGVEVICFCDNTPKSSLDDDCCSIEDHDSNSFSLIALAQDAFAQSALPQETLSQPMHHHHSENSESNCTAKTYYVVRSASADEKNDHHYCDHNKHERMQAMCLYLVAQLFVCDQTPLSVAKSPYKPFLLRAYAYQGFSNSGLRAPPVA